MLEKSLVTVLVTVGVGDLRRLHRSWNTDVVILLFLTFVVTRVLLSSKPVKREPPSGFPQPKVSLQQRQGSLQQ